MAIGAGRNVKPKFGTASRPNCDVLWLARGGIGRPRNWAHAQSSQRASHVCRISGREGGRRARQPRHRGSGIHRRSSPQDRPNERATKTLDPGAARSLADRGDYRAHLAIGLVMAMAAWLAGKRRCLRTSFAIPAPLFLVSASGAGSGLAAVLAAVLKGDLLRQAWLLIMLAAGASWLAARARKCSAHTRR